VNQTPISSFACFPLSEPVSAIGLVSLDTLFLKMGCIDRLSLPRAFLLVLCQGVPDFLRALETKIGTTEVRWPRARKLAARGAPATRWQALLIKDPTAILATIGISRAAGSPVTYFGVTAASSIIMPADLPLALVAWPQYRRSVT
jgi:hypothetical protein